MKKSNLNARFLKVYSKYPETHDFNCWAGTLMYFNELKTPRWIEQREMIQWMEANTKRVTRKRKNDIIALFDGGNEGLLHTAVYLGDGKVWHKKGANVAEITTIEKMLKVYFETEEIVIMRPKKKAA
jgi:hypothetical protein